MAGGVKRKSGGASAHVGANKKKKTSSSSSSSSSSSTVKSNPFEFRKSQEKSSVLGKAQPRSNKPAGNARAHAFELRKNTLLQELEQQEKHNTFIDKREKKVESLKGLTSHEIIKVKFNKLLGKAPKERGVIKKKNIYNLADDEVTFTGSSLGLKTATIDEPDDLNDEAPEVEEGGGEKGENDKDGKKKNNRERYAEIIAKSKYHKYLRQKEKEEREEQTEELNDALKELQEEIYTSKRTKADADEDEGEKKDDYMQLLRTFQMEGRAPASDRSRTTEEIMREESEKLLKMEEERLKRMLGVLQGEEGGARLTSGDDLTDDFGPVLASDDEEEEEEEEDEEGEEGEDDDDEDDEDELYADMLDERKKAMFEAKNRKEEEDVDEIELGSDEEEEEEEEGEDGEGEKDEESSTKEEIPFKIDAPENYKAFMALLEGRTVKERIIITDRIMVGNHYTLNRAQNVPKMRVFFRILWQRFIEVSKFKAASKIQSFTELNHLGKYLWELSQQFPEITYNLAKDSNEKLYEKFSEHINDTEKDALSMQIVVFMQLIGNLFPTTDYQNVVVTPAFCFIGQAITLSPIIKLSQLSRVLFLSSIAFTWVSEAHRFVTEPLNFLGAILERFADPVAAKRYFTCPSLLPFDSKNFQLKSSKLSPSPLDLTTITFAEDTIISEQHKIDILNYVLLLTSKYFELYTDGKTQNSLEDCTPQLFSPIKAALLKIQDKPLCQPVQEVVNNLVKSMEMKINSALVLRKPLFLQDSGPSMITALNPKYNPNYNGKKVKMSELPERVVKHKIKKRVRKEQLKAEKELRKDTQFIQHERMKKIRAEDEAAKKHTRKVMALLEGEAHEQKLDRIRRNPIKFK